MFRNGLVHASKVLFSKRISISFSPELYASGYTAVYDARRCTQVKDVQRPLWFPVDQSLLSSRHLMTRGSRSLLPHSPLSNRYLVQDSSHLRWSSTSFQMPNPAELTCNLINMARCVDLNDLKDAPPPSFWVTISLAAAQLGIPFLELIGGYSPIMTYLQLYIAAAHLIWNGGQTWGLAISSNPKPTTSWDTMNMSLMPAGLAVLGLLLPYPLGFLTVASGLVASLYCDMKSCVYPAWAVASKFLVVLTSTVGLLLALVAYVLFHNKNTKNKNETYLLPFTLLYFVESDIAYGEEKDDEKGKK